MDSLRRSGRVQLKIVHVITRLIVGGAQENTLLTCEGLRRRGQEVILITGPSRGPEGSLLPRARSGGYEVMELPALRRNPHPAADFSAYGELRRIFARFQPDVVHTHSSKAGILGRAAAWKQRVPVIVHTMHGLAFHPYQGRLINMGWILLERWAARRCHAIVAVADAMTRQALREGIGRPEQFTTIYSGMEIDKFTPRPEARQLARRKLGIGPEKIVIGTIARLQPLKGHDDILKIAPRVLACEPNLHFLWIGDGVFNDRFQSEIRSRNWSDRFTLTGLVSPEQVAELIPAMDILLHPSYREGLPRAVPQALLAGVPVIVYDCDGAAEICLHSRTGVLIQPGDIATMGDAVLELTGDADKRRRLALRARELAASLFDANIMVAKLETLYEKLHAKFSPEEPR